MYGDISNWTTRFGVLGKSIYDIRDAINSVLKSVSNGDKSLGSALKDQLFPTKANIKDKLIDIDKELPKVDESTAKGILETISKIESKTDDATAAFQALYNAEGRQNKWIAEYANATKGQIRSTEGVIKANKNARDSAIMYNNTLQSTTLGAKAAELGLKALALAGNVLFTFAISSLVTGLYEMSQASKQIADKAAEAGSEFKSASSSVDEYKGKIDELKAVTEDSGSSIEQVTEARQGLLDIQSEIIEKYGTEKSVIDTVTDSINEQTSALDNLTDKAWRKEKNDFNDNSFWDNAANFFQGYSSNVDRMMDEYEKYAAKIDLNQYADFAKDGENLNEFIRIAQSLGGKLNISDTEGSFIEFDGVAEDVADVLDRIQKTAENLQLSDKFQKHLGDLSKDADDLTDKYKAFYDQYILQEEILSDSGKQNGYADIYKQLVDAKQKIDDAFKSGDDSAREDAIKEYASILSSALSENGDNEVTQWLRSMYPDIQTEVSKWVFKINFDANTDGLKEKLEGYIKTFTDKDYTSEDIISYDPSKSNDTDLESAYRGINTVLQDTGLELKDIIPLFEELGLVQNRVQKTLSDKFGQDKVNTLTPDELEIVKGFSQVAIDSCNSWEDLIKLIEEAKLAAQDAATELSSARSLKDINEDKSGIGGLFDKYENGEGKLSQDEVASILEANPEYIAYLIKVGDQYKLNKQALEDWNKVNDEQELAIDNQMGGNKYLESYDKVLSDIKNPASHGNGDGVGGTGISEQLDDLIAKNQELNTSFLNGKISASDYFSNLSSYITDSGLEEALYSLDGKFDDTTDYIEETVSVLSTELSDALLQSNKRFLKGETSVSQYIDELQAGTDAQKKLLASTYNLQANSSGMVEITDDMSDSTKKAAESYNELVQAQTDLEGASGLADTLRDNADFLTQYTDEAGNLMSSIFQDNQFDSYISSMSDKIAEFASSSIDNMSSTAEWLSQTAGISLQEATDIIGQGGNAIQDTVGSSLEGVGSMTSFAMQSVQGSISNASTAIGSVLTSLGNMISSFKYKIEAKPYIKDYPSVKTGENGVPQLDLGTYGLEFTGSGGESVKQFASALNSAGGYFTKAGTEQANAKVLDLDSYKTKNDGNTAGGYRPTYEPKKSKSGNKGSGDKDPTEFDWIERKHKLMEEEMSKLKEQSSDTSLRYTGLDNDTINRALALFDQIHNQITISTDDFSWLAQAASSAGMSLDEFFLHLQDGGGVSRMSALQEILERDKKDLETYTQDAQTYSSMYEEAVSKLTPEYREKIEHGGNDIEELPDKENEAVQKAVKLYDKKKEAEQKVFDIQKDIHDTQSSMYDLELEELEKQNDEIEGRNSLITKQIDYLNTSGRLVNGTAYETLIANLGKQKSIIEQELEVKKRELAAMMESNPDYENSQEYYDLQKSISDSELSLIDLTNQQAEYNDTLRQLPINNAQKLVDMYNDISTAMENWKNEIESAGKSVDADYYQEQIKNGRLTIKQLQEQRAAVEDVMDEYETGSDKWAEMNSKLTDIDSSISSIVVNMNEWNEAMLQIPIDKMDKLVSDLQMVKDALDDVNSEHQTVISAVTGAIDDQREAWEEAQKAETDAIQGKIDAIQDQLDLLDKQNEALDLQIAQEQALKKLEDAKTQKKNRVVRDGEVVYEADQDAIREAADSLQDAEANLKKHELQTEKEKLEDELDTINDKYDDLYDKLDKIANKWDKIQSDREQLGNEQVANRYLGDDWINKVLSGNDDDIYSAFKDLYNQNVDSQEQYESQIKSTQQIQTLVNTYIEAYRSGTLTRDQAMIGIKSVLSSVNHEITAGDNVHNILTYLSTQNSTGATTNDILAATKNQLSTTSKDIMKSLNVYEKNSNMITKYMSSFGELTSNVSDMRSTIHTVSKNLDSIENTISDGIDDIVDAINSINIEVDRESSTSTKHETSSAPNGWQGTHEFDHDNGKEGYEVGWTRKYANGIEEGIIGNAGDKEKYMAIREMATTDLKPSEQPILAHTGEIVLNPEQQAQLLKNIQQSTMVFRPEVLNLKPVNMPMIDRAQPNVVYNNYGNFELKDVRDVDGFAKAVGRDFDRCIRQAVSKRW